MADDLHHGAPKAQVPGIHVQIPRVQGHHFLRAVQRARGLGLLAPNPAQGAGFDHRMPHIAVCHMAAKNAMAFLGIARQGARAADFNIIRMAAYRQYVHG